jgi:hypothetical protein
VPSWLCFRPERVFPLELWMQCLECFNVAWGMPLNKFRRCGTSPRGVQVSDLTVSPNLDSFRPVFNGFRGLKSLVFFGISLSDMPRLVWNTQHIISRELQFLGASTCCSFRIALILFGRVRIDGLVLNKLSTMVYESFEWLWPSEYSKFKRSLSSIMSVICKICSVHYHV